jgi:ABC-2 type transport system ATP-binding protein
MIQVRGLTKVFPAGLKAVDELDLTVAKGEILGLLGPNGAGKSTTIRTLATLCGFDSGKVIVAGYDVDREPEKVRQCIGVVAQNTGIDYFLTGRENLELQGHLYRMKKADIKARVAELARYFELESGLDRQVATYSGGMRRKLDIATALIHRPALLFLDEPTLGLDIKSRKMLWRYIEQLNQETGLTILLTTHYLEEADRLAHRVAIISGGKIRALGTPDELKATIAGDALTVTLEQQDWAAQQFVTALKQTDYVKDAMWEGNKLHLYVTSGAESVPRISELAGKHAVSILSLSLARPSLDDVFLKYTGSSMEDNSEDSGDEWWKQWAGKGGGKWQKQWNENRDATDESGEEGGAWQSGQWAHTDESGPASAGQSGAATDGRAGAERPEQTWSPEEMAKWQNQQQGAASDAARETDTKSAEPWKRQWSEGETARRQPEPQPDKDEQHTRAPRDDAAPDHSQPDSERREWPDTGASNEWGEKKWSGNPTEK